jgi:hypothetical protein
MIEAFDRCDKTRRFCYVVLAVITLYGIPGLIRAIAELFK